VEELLAELKSGNAAQDFSVDAHVLEDGGEHLDGTALVVSIVLEEGGGNVVLCEYEEVLSSELEMLWGAWSLGAFAKWKAESLAAGAGF